MTLILLQVMTQSISSTLTWLGLYIGVRSLSGGQSRRWPWALGSAVVLAAWLFAIVLLAADGFFRFDLGPTRVPAALLLTLAAGYLALLSGTFRRIIADIPQHWLIAIQAFRILGGMFLIRYFQGELPATFAVSAGVGDVLPCWLPSPSPTRRQ